MEIDYKIDLKKLLKQAIEEEGVEKVLYDVFADMKDSDFSDALEWLEENHNLIEEE